MQAVVKLADYSPSEADYLRKAIAKKQKGKLKEHRGKFIVGAVKKGIKEEVAAAIFDEWLEFARYGFNKSHAAVYGLMAVQTAFLKAHYPAEYMAALMSVFKDDTDKIMLYIRETREMGIDVLPPDVNTSQYDFSIEDRLDGKTAIRFGLGAIKNVGYGPVKTILRAREEGGPFHGLDDFVQRVDLREVGKRALESLIKAGALDAFGNRGGILSIIDRILGQSASYFRAAEAGQLSLFGGQVASFNAIHIPQEVIDRHQLLNWERELIGVYISDHPLSPYVDFLTKGVSHNAKTLAAARKGDKVRVAGLLVRLRKHYTQKSKAEMAFATIEDLHGQIELVIFPRTWEKFKSMLVLDQVVVIDGKADDGSPPKILVDAVQKDMKILEAAPEFQDVSAAASLEAQLRAETPLAAWDDESPMTGVAEPAAAYLEEDWASADESEVFAVEEIPAVPPPAEPAPVPANGSRPPAEERPELAQHPRLLTVTLRASGRPEQDRRLVERVCRHLQAHPGKDRFMLRILENGQDVLIEFPRHTTDIAAAKAKLLTWVREDDCLVEPWRAPAPSR